MNSATAAHPWTQPRAPRSSARFWLWLAIAVAVATTAFAVMARGVPTLIKHERYSVSVPVTFRPHDEAAWALLNAEDYAAAIAIDPTLPDPFSVDHADAATAPPLDAAQLREEAFVGPAAKPYVFRAATPTDRARAHYCLTAAIYYEAASETDDGMRGVAQVVLNRVRHPSFPSTVCGVVFQGSERAIVCQFTFSCDGAMARSPERGNWGRASRIAAEALNGKVFASVGLATHYHTQAIWPRWGKSLVMTNIVGAHIFHRWRGRWGMPDAFRVPYSGREPTPGPYLPVAQQLAIKAGRGMPTPTGPVAAPLPGTATFPASATPTAGPVPAMPTAPLPPPVGSAPVAGPRAPTAPAPKTDYLDSRLNQSGQVRDEFKGSGEWIR
jgi:spore germination cell wall hydrolase CwlJ-like protein